MQAWKRLISTLTAIALIVPSLGARDASCFCSSCDLDAGCCSAKSCCDTSPAPNKPCGCCSANPAGSHFAVAPETSVPQGCQCVSPVPTEVVLTARAAQIDRADFLAVVPEPSALAPHNGPAVRNVELANLLAKSGPPLRILYCSWLE